MDIKWMRKDFMKKETYESPELVRIGNVKDLTLGGAGAAPDQGGAGSFVNARPP